jgi:hypothetical protein
MYLEASVYSLISVCIYSILKYLIIVNGWSDIITGVMVTGICMFSRDGFSIRDPQLVNFPFTSCYFAL